jgi:hypothetical protein
MPLQKLTMRPGVNREGTNYSNEGGWYDCNNIRFRSGFPEKIGGWVRLSVNTFKGVCRSLWNWVTLAGSNLIGIGTNLKYYIESGTLYYDITPIRKTTTGTAKFAATTGSAVLTVTDATHGCLVGDFVTYTLAVSLGGTITATVLNQEYQITSVSTANTYTINVTTLANASDTGNGGGATVAKYQINVGTVTQIPLIGWGGGGWGLGTWGVGSPSNTELRLWSNDNYGQDLIIAPRNGGIYYWVASTGVTVRAQALSDLSTAAGYDGDYVPNQTLEISASSIQRFVISFGANAYFAGDPNTTFNPMLIRWSDQDNPFQWVPDITNQSGEFPLSHGSYIVSYINTRQEILVWTDSALYSMQYLGPPYVWKFEILMDNISVISPNSMITINNITYWMGVDKFYMYSGRVDSLPCSLRQYVFNDINISQAQQVFCGGNEGYNEIWWFYCSTDSTTIDKYVIYNYLDKVWYYGSMSRTAWLDSGLREYPMAANYDNTAQTGRLLYHEANVDDVAGVTPVPIEAFIQSSDFDIGDGHNFGFVWRILPDVNFNGSNVNNPYVTMTIKPRQNSGSPYGVANSPEVQSADNYAVSRSYNIQLFDGQVYTRLRGRQMALRIESTELGVAWQLGSPRLDIRADGRR